MQKEYKLLLQDTITYLKSLDASHIHLDDNIINKLKTYYKHKKPTLKIKPAVKQHIIKKQTSFIKKEQQQPKPIEKKVEKKLSKPVVIKEKLQIKIDNFDDIKLFIKTTSPNTKILDIPIDDKLAKKLLIKYKLKEISYPITILAYKENEIAHKFLEKIAKAISVYFYDCRVISAYAIEKKEMWEELLSEKVKLIITSDITISELKGLNKHYKKNPITSQQFVKNIPIFLLPDISIYLKEPTLKKSLFMTLKETFKKLK